MLGMGEAALTLMHYIPFRPSNGLSRLKPSRSPALQRSCAFFGEELFRYGSVALPMILLLADGVSPARTYDGCWKNCTQLPSGSLMITLPRLGVAGLRKSRNRTPPRF